MKPIRLKLYNAKGIINGLLKDEIEIDFTRFQPGVIVIGGVSGSGKTTILNNLHPYRQVGISNSNFADHFEKGGYREFDFEFRNDIYLSQIYTDKALLFKNGKLLNKSQKLTEYDKKLEESGFPDADMYFNLLYGGDTFNNILDLKKGERKQLILDFLLSDLNKYLEYETTFKKEQESLVQKISDINIKINEHSYIDSEIEELNKKIESINEDKKLVILNVDNYKRLLTLYNEQEEKNKNIREEINKLTKEWAEKKNQYNNILTNKKHLEEKIENARKEYKDIKSRIGDVENPGYDKKELEQQLKDIEKEDREKFRERQENDIQYTNLLNQITHYTEKLISLKENSVPCNSDLQLKCPLTKFTNYLKVIEDTEAELKELQKEHEKFKKIDYNVDDYLKLKSEIESKIELVNDYERKCAYVERLETIVNEGKQYKSDLEKILIDSVKKELDSINENLQVKEKEINNSYDDVSDSYNEHLIRLKEIDIKMENYKENIIKNQEKLKRVDEYKKESEKLNSELANYDLLIKFFGKNGGMLWEIENAGDKITNIANQLLQNYINKEIVIRFDTLKTNKKGELKEVFDITVSIDGKEPQTYVSGGEKVLVSNSIREAMLYLNEGRDYKIIMLNESDGSIDTKARIGFIKLLEQANELNNRDYTFLVTHSDEIKAYVQQRIELENGEINITY